MTRPVNVRDAARTVFAVLSRHMDPGQVYKVRAALPEEIRRMREEAPGAPARPRA